MRVSRSQAAENRQTVINVASRLFRERGFDGIGLKDLMKGAGLTQGAFYKQFASKDDLAAQASKRALESASRAWVDQPLGGEPTALPIAADLVLPLGAGRGFVYLDRGTVGILSPSGEATALASGATAIAMSRDGTQIAYTVPTATRTEIWGLAVELRSRFLLQTERGRYILTLYEKRVRESDLPFFIGLMRHLAQRGLNCPQPVSHRQGEALEYSGKYTGSTDVVGSRLSEEAP